MIWAAEYSPVQKAFHVDTLEKILEVNRQTAERGLSPGFVPLYIAASQEEARAFVERWRRGHGG